MVPNMCKCPAFSVSSGVLILGRWDYQILKYILYTTKYHPNTRNYFRCLLKRGVSITGKGFYGKNMMVVFCQNFELPISMGNLFDYTNI